MAYASKKTLLQLPQPMVEWVRQHAQEECRTMSDIYREAVRDYQRKIDLRNKDTGVLPVDTSRPKTEYM